MMDLAIDLVDELVDSLPQARRGPRRTMTLGIVMSVLGWSAFIVGFVLLGMNMFETVQDGLDPESELAVSVGVPGEGAMTLEPGRYQVVALGIALTTVSGMSSDAGGLDVNRMPFAEPQVSVVAPNGEPIALEPPTVERVTHTPGLDAVGIREFTVTTAGTYVLRVDGQPGAVTKVGVGDAESIWDSAKPFLTSSAIIAGGGIVGGLGVTVLIIGIVWRAIGGATSSMGGSAGTFTNVLQQSQPPAWRPPTPAPPPAPGRFSGWSGPDQ
jgi:hypothetical protein